MTVQTATPSRLIKRPVIRTPADDLADALTGILLRIHRLQGQRRHLATLSRPRREVCYGCGCLCFEDEACPGCRAATVSRRDGMTDAA